MSDFPDLQLAAGSYPLTVIHPEGQELSGYLELQVGRTPHGEIFGWPYVTTGGAASFPQPAEPFPALLCHLQMGYDVLLVSAQVESLFPGRARLWADAAIVGSDLASNPESDFPEASLQVTNGHRLFGLAPVVPTQSPNTLPAAGEVDFVAKISVDANRTYRHENTEVRCRYWYLVRNFDRFRFEVQTAPVFELRSPGPLSAAEWIKNHVLPLRELVTLATLESQTVAWLNLDREPGEPGNKNQVFSSDIQQVPYSPVQDIPNDGRSLFVFPELPYSPVVLLQRWETLRQTHQSFIEPLMRALVQPMDSRGRFLSLVQALEGLHTQVYGEGPVPIEDHQRKRAEILAEIKKLGLPKDQRTFLHRWLDSYGRYSLHQRLEDLRNEVASEVSGFVDLELVPGNVPEYRNKLSHGAKTYPAEVLHPVNRALAVIGVGHVLRQLELPLDRINRVFT